MYFKAKCGLLAYDLITYLLPSLLTYLLTAFDFSLGGSSSYNSNK